MLAGQGTRRTTGHTAGMGLVRLEVTAGPQETSTGQLLQEAYFSLLVLNYRDREG